MIQGLQLQKTTAWIEEPGFTLTRTALNLAGINVKSIPVDAEGLDVVAGERDAPEAALAIVTPGQQAPLGMTLSLSRRLALLEWAKRNGAWIVEDDYLSELQLSGRAAPALASLDQSGRVLHIGTFSKTLSPTLRLGFMVVPPELVRRFGDVSRVSCAGARRRHTAGGRGIAARRLLSAPPASYEAPLFGTKRSSPSFA